MYNFFFQPKPNGLNIQNDLNIHGKPYRTLIYTTTQEKNYCTIIDLMNHGFRVTASWRLKEILKGSTLICNAGCCMSEQRLPHRWKIPFVVRIISLPLCIHYCKCWTSLTAVVQTVDCRCHLRQKYKGFKSGERAGHAVGPPRPIQCLQSDELQFVNILSANKVAILCSVKKKMFSKHAVQELSVCKKKT